MHRNGFGLTGPVWNDSMVSTRSPTGWRGLETRVGPVGPVVMLWILEGGRGGVDGTVPLREAAARLGLSPEALRKRIEKGQLPAQREPGGHRRYLIPERALAGLAADIAEPAGPSTVRRLRVVGEGELPVEAVGDLVGLLREQFEALQGERDRLLAEVGRLQGELDSAEVRSAALQGELERLRRRLADAPSFFLAGLGRLEQEWRNAP